MGTRGAVGFVIKGEEKFAYNHYDSYPDGLGVEVLKFLREFPGGIEAMAEKAEKLQLVSDDVPATPEQILELRETTNWFVNQYSMAGPDGWPELPTEDVQWYNLLHRTQGDLAASLEVGYMEGANSFPLDSLFCEWAYVIDLDAEVLEVYVGFQKELPTSGRWDGRPTAEEDAVNYKRHLKQAAEQGRDPWRPKAAEYKAIALIKTYPFDKLPSDEVFLAEINALTARGDEE